MQPLTTISNQHIRSHRALFASILALALCLAAVFAPADALPAGTLMLQTPETAGVLYVSRALTLPDGTLLIGGQVQYPGEYREPYQAGYQDPRDTIRNDAVVMRIDPGGEILWSVRLGDPQAANYFAPVGLLPDGRALLSFSAVDSTFGDRYFIIGLDGVIEEMLPWREIAAHYAPRSLMLMPESGYLGGDSTVVDDYYEHHTGRWANPSASYTRILTLLDFDLSVRWQIDLSPLGAAIGNHNAVEVSGGIALLGYESMRPEGAEPDAWLSNTSVLMLHKDTGDILWQLTDAPRDDGMAGANTLVETPDGSLLFTGAYSEPGQTLGEGENLVTLTKLTKDGQPVWTKRYDHLGIGSFFRMLPFEDGYLMQGYSQGTPYHPIFVYVDEAGELLGTLSQGADAERTMSWPHLFAAPDGTAYLTGALYTKYDAETDTGGEVAGSFLVQLTAAHFLEGAALEQLP